MFDRFLEFKALATYQNFTKAAMSLNLSEPTLSKHIVQLEQQVGCQLINRNPVVLTEAGLYFLEQFSSIYSNAYSLFEECRRISAHGLPKLTVAQLAYRGLLSSLLNRSLVRLAQTNSGFTYTYEQGRETSVVQSVREGLSDVGFTLVDMPEERDLAFNTLWEQEYRVLLHRANPLAQRQCRFEELASCVTTRSTNRKLSVLDDSVRRICRDYGFEPTFKLRDYDVVLMSVLNMSPDEMIFVAAELAEGLQVDNPNLMVPDIEVRWPMTFPLYLVHRKDNQNPLIPLLLQMLRENGQDAIGGNDVFGTMKSKGGPNTTSAQTALP